MSGNVMIEQKQRREVQSGKLSKIINFLLKKSRDDKKYLDLICAMLIVIRESADIFYDYRTSLIEYEDCFEGIIEIQEGVLVKFEYEKGRMPEEVIWTFIDIDLIKPFLK